MCLTALHVLQVQTYAKRDSLAWNMCGSYLVVQHDNIEVQQVNGETQEITRLVASRSEDISFATNLGSVLLKHVSCLKEQQASTSTGDALHAQPN